MGSSCETARRNTASATAQSASTWARDSAPEGSSRIAVRGFRASSSASMSLFRDMASVRAPTIAMGTQTRFASPATHPRRGRRRRTRTGARRQCARYERAMPAAAAAGASRPSRLPVGGRGVAGRQLEPMPQRGANDGEAVAAPTRRAGQVHDERLTDETGDATRKERMRGASDRVGADRLRDPRSLALDHGARRLGRHVPRRDAGPPVSGRATSGPRELARSLPQMPTRVVGHHPPLDLDSLLPSSRRSSSRTSALVVAYPRAATPSDTVTTAAFTPVPCSSRPTGLLDRHPLVDGLRHVVHGQRGYRDCHEGLHLDSGLRRRLGRASIETASSSTSSSTSICVRGSGWQSGISSAVRLAAMIPASLAVTSARLSGGR